VTAQFVFQVKSADEPRDRRAEDVSAAAGEPEKRKHRFFRRKKEERKETE